MCCTIDLTEQQQQQQQKTNEYIRVNEAFPFSRSVLMVIST